MNMDITSAPDRLGADLDNSIGNPPTVKSLKHSFSTMIYYMLS